MKFLKLLGSVSSFVAPSPAISVPPVKAPIETTGQILDLAADLIEKQGWTSGQFRDKKGRICVLQAIDEASDLVGHHNKMGYLDIILNRISAENQFAVSKDLGPTRISIWSWNDRLWRTKGQVVKSLRKAAQ